MNRQAPHSAMSAESADSRPRTIRSLDRRSFHSPKASNRSLIEVMSLQQSSCSEDIFQKLIRQRVDVHMMIEKSRRSKTFSQMSIEEESSGQESVMAPEPKVYSGIQAPEQSQERVALKRKSLRLEPQCQPQTEAKIWCTCRKSKCVQKYCSCFSVGMKCGRGCKCEQCENWGRVQPIGEVKAPYLQLLPEEQLMPTQMKFVEFQYKLN